MNYRLFSCVALCLLTNSVHAELPLIRLDRIFPLGGQAGSEVEFEIGGRDLEELSGLHFDHAGLKATSIKQNLFKLTIGADVPTGTYEVRGVGKYGISGVQVFQVSRGLTEVKEVEPNDEPDKAQKVTVNSAINGRCDGNGDDFYRFSARKGQRLVIDCLGFRLNSTLRAILTLSTSEGKDLLQSKPYYNLTDPFLDFVAPADGDYLVRLHDMTFNGGLPYRLVISDHPQIENAFPAAVVPGQKTDITLFGRNLGAGPVPSTPGQEPILEQRSVQVAVPDDPAVRQRFSFLHHLPSPTLNARAVQIWPEGVKNPLNPVTLVLADAPVTRDQEPNDSPESAQAVSLPTVISGRFDKPGDVDWYSFTAKTNDNISVDLLCERLDFPGDPFVLVFDKKGNEISAIDDHGINSNSLAQFNRDPLGTFRIPSDGEYRVAVQERYRHGGQRYPYVLRLGKAKGDFYPVVYHETPVDPTCPVIRQGGSAHYDVCLNRRDYNGTVIIEAEGLPAGVTCPPAHISPQTQTASLVFTAAPDAPAWQGPIRLKAWSMIDGQKVEREVRCSQRRWPIDNRNTSVVVRQVCLAVRETAPYGLRLPDKQISVPAGGNFEFVAKGTRNWPDFKGNIQLNGLSLPPGFGFATSNLPANQTEVTCKMTVANNVPPGLYSIILRGDAQVPFNRDSKATSRPNTRVADPSTPMTILVTEAPKKK